MTNQAKNTTQPGQPFNEWHHSHLARRLPTACWVLRLYAASIEAAYSNNDNPDKAELARVARQAANLAAELLARMAAASREEFPAAAWLKRYSTPQPPDLSKQKKSKKRPRA